MAKSNIYEDISDVIFTPKKKSLVRKIFIALILGFIILAGIILFLYSQGYTINLSSLANSNIKLLEKGNRLYTVKTFARKPCGMQVGGDEIYTDWFEVKGDIWKIKLNSEKVSEGELSNVRVWYTTSNVPILDEILSNSESSYVEIGNGTPNYDTGNKIVEQDTSGPGIYRLRILCWNSNYTIEVQDSY